ncbi:unnamed protein product [Prorocentrum cordatum]|uniref:Uncharacterized protein n=1 Tax=Prorocentrum cordatum TaxID=2364126 RepID=A0ABN9XVU9_9DINO|nr:unnamed protein product [Polarella glacialis]
MVFKSKIASCVQGGMQLLHGQDRLFEKAWRKFAVKEEERLDIECEAERQHQAGKLLRRARRDENVPKNLSDDEVLEWPPEDLQRSRGRATKSLAGTWMSPSATSPSRRLTSFSWTRLLLGQTRGSSVAPRCQCWSTMSSTSIRVRPQGSPHCLRLRPLQPRRLSD